MPIVLPILGFHILIQMDCQIHIRLHQPLIEYLSEPIHEDAA
jgi:hypothetical protein